MIARRNVLPIDRSTTLERQRQVVETIIGHVDANGFPPSLREIAATLGISLSRVAQVVTPLVEAGVVTCRPRSSRTLAVNHQAAARFFAT
jgi:SOS-response transcriptional repressor LexA